MSVQAPAGLPPQLVSQLAELADDPSRQEFLRSHPQLQERSIVLLITEEVVRTARKNVEHAERIAWVAAWLSEVLNDDFCRARSARAAGHVLSIKGKHQEALNSYEEAASLFDAQGDEIESAITLSGSLQPLIYLGRYAEAHGRAEKARGIFKRHDDRLRLARLDVNVANILHRQDRFEDALVLYGRARQTLEEFSQHRDVAVVLANTAVSCISCYDFASALGAYQQARIYCDLHNMPLLAAQADYNIAYLYFLRGESARAIELYGASRAFSDKVGDAYHRALCDLDESEMYLELNLPVEAELFAQQAFARFESMQMGYEAAKALSFLGIAADQQRKPFLALELFAKARVRFENEQNSVWPALLDLYSALVLYHEGRAYEARRSCDAALRFLAHSSLVGKAALTELLHASLHLAVGEATPARFWCDRALERIARADSPALRYLAYLVLGRVLEAQKDARAAYQSYCKSLAALESLPTQRQAEELKIPFVKDKLAVYEALVATGLSLPDGRKNQETAFAVIEKAKSRQLADLIAFRAHALPAPASTRSGLVARVMSLREELNWYHRQIDLGELRQEKPSAEQLARLRQRTREHEAQLLKTLGELQATDEEFLSLQNAATVPLDSIREVLDPDAVLVDYYQAQETIYACVVGARHFSVVPLTSAARVQNMARLLQGQFAQFRLGADHLRELAKPKLEPALLPLQELYDELIAPLRGQVDARHLIIAPHGFLHYLPFPALHDGARFLVEEFAVSYSTSASLYYLCCTKKQPVEDRALVLAVPDGHSQQAAEEAEAIAAAVPNAKVLVGEAASDAALRDQGPGSRYVHLSTGATFRGDNPLFSSLRLGNSQLSLFDLYHLRLPCELVSLSGCGPGLNPAGNGEELAGMLRGLLYAGAEAVLTSIWNVPGASTTKLLEAFYRHLRGPYDKAGAMQKAMLELREAYPHPYFWAPFALHGKARAR